MSKSLFNLLSNKIMNRLDNGASKKELYMLISSYYKRLTNEEKTKLYELIDDLY